MSMRVMVFGSGGDVFSGEGLWSGALVVVWSAMKRWRTCRRWGGVVSNFKASMTICLGPVTARD